MVIDNSVLCTACLPTGFHVSHGTCNRSSLPLVAQIQNLKLKIQNDGIPRFTRDNFILFNLYQ